MQILEQLVVPKNPAKKSEDLIVITDDFIAVVDGSTSKSNRRHSLFCSNGRYAARLVGKYIRRMSSAITCQQFCRGVTAYIRAHYRHSQLPQLASHPEDRLTASAVVFSRLQREVWLIGDCQCLIGGQLYDNPKPYEEELARMRSAEIHRLIAEGIATEEQLLADDTARPTIIPRMIETMHRQNVDYAVIDGFPIPFAHVRTVTLDFQPWEIVLASDGYPRLCPTLAESEAYIDHLRLSDPLCYQEFLATKGFYTGNSSFDDRSYIRFQV
ncbi:MAG: hypothetical protein IJ710_07910 [Prevotella sp.]|nr:hypothetical protein [Prevotella sp.]